MLPSKCVPDVDILDERVLNVDASFICGKCAYHVVGRVVLHL